MRGSIKMRARVAFDHRGERLRAGQVFTTTPLQAAALRYQQKAAFFEEHSVKAQERKPVSANDAPTEDKVEGKKVGGTRAYRRRDMRAEGSSGESD